MIFSKSKIAQVLFCVTSLYSCASFAIQSNVPSGSPTVYKDMVPTSNVHAFLALLGGYARIDAGESHTYEGTDSEKFSYHDDSGDNSGVLGALLGIEWLLPYPDFSAQLGIEYNNFGSVEVNGSNETGVDPDTSTPYDYEYHVKSQQLLLVGKVLRTTYERFYPYLLVGIGAAYNRATDFSTSTSQTGSINIAPTFKDGDRKTSFSYALGLGVDMDINTMLRIGIGYQFSDLGKSALNNGVVTYGEYQAPVSFAPKSSHIYVNELVASVSVRM